MRNTRKTKLLFGSKRTPMAERKEPTESKSRPNEAADARSRSHTPIHPSDSDTNNRNRELSPVLFGWKSRKVCATSTVPSKPMSKMDRARITEFEANFAKLGQTPAMTWSPPQRLIAGRSLNDSFSSNGATFMPKSPQTHKILRFDGIDRIVVENAAAAANGADALQKTLDALRGQLESMASIAVGRRCLVERGGAIARAQVVEFDDNLKRAAVRLIDSGEWATLSADK